MSGGKGGSTSSSVTIPEYIEEAARRNLAKAEDISQIGYVPYYGPDVAAFTPFQQAGFQQTADVASAFGLGPQMSQADVMGGMPAPTEFAGGVRGYSAAPLYQQAVDELAAQRPAQAQYIESFFIDPVTGQAGTRVQPAVDYSTMGTMADIRAADRANELAIAQAQAAAGPQNVTYETTSFAANPNLSVQPDDQIFNIAPPEVQISQQIMATDPTNPDYNSAFGQVYDYQSDQAAQDPTGQSTGFGITPEIVDAAGVDAFLPPTAPSDYTLDPAISAAIDEIGYTPMEGRTLAEGEQAILGLEPQEYTGFIDMIDGGGPNAAGGPFEGGGLLSDIGNFMTSGGITGAALRGVGGALEPAFDAVESGLATLFNDPRTFEERDADRLATEAAMAAMPADESAAVQAQMEAAAVEQEKLKVADPEAFVAQFAQSDQADAVQAVQKAQALSVSPRPPNLTSDKARDWIKANLGINVDKKDATDMIRSLQADWDRQNG
jgi:hypothetical protein